MSRAIPIFLVALLTFSPAISQEKLDWLLIYYMPYDNNLSVVSSDIIDQFLKADVSPNSCVTLQVDLSGTGGVTRYAISSKVDSIHIDEERSASAKTFSEYLIWAAKTYKAKHYGVVLLSHGGSLDQYGQDMFPKEEWMPTDSIAYTLAQFNQAAKISKLDIFFEQVCVRAAVENLFEFRDVAQFTMASQHLVPAPNYYYPKLFLQLDSKITSGEMLANLIVQYDRDDMYYSYVLIDNSKWTEWLAKMHGFNKSLANADSKLSLNMEEVKLTGYGGQLYFDFTSLLKAVPDVKGRKELVDYTNNFLIRRYYVNKASKVADGYSGLSILSPFRVEMSALRLLSQAEYKEFVRVLMMRKDGR